MYEPSALTHSVATDPSEKSADRSNDLASTQTQVPSSVLVPFRTIYRRDGDALQTSGLRRGCNALRDQMKRGEIARRGDDGVDREAGLQNGQNPAQHLKTDHTNPGDDLPCQKHPK